MEGGGEQRALDWLAAHLPAAPAGQTWLGDDAAVVDGPAGSLLLCADVVVEGVHADLGLVGLDDLGWKAVAVNVSDIAAMGGRPAYALVTVAGPPHTDLALLYEGISEAALAYGVAVVGGDLSGAPALMVSVALTGVVEGPAVLRSGARAGDRLFLTGALGRSAAGLEELRAGRRDGPNPSAHRRPRARLAEGEAARLAGASAMIDVSDGLAIDLGRLASASGVGAALREVPVASGATLEQALHGGEDYELVFAAPDARAALDRFRGMGLDEPVDIGCCVEAGAGLSLQGEALPPGGYQHPWRVV
ncbi:MAG TPA: thiamine-phosphate kinase [Acidimicrobiales bacterium]|nr:thiamine-phosphate kinase [Acidimicrobiales bacterium]